MVGVAVGQIQQRVDVGHTELVAATAGAHDLVAGANLALGDDAEVEARTMLRDKQIGHLGLIQAHADPKAGDARLGDFEFGAANAVAVPDAYFVVTETRYGEVLPELPGS